MANTPSSQRLLSLITMDNTGVNRGKVKSLVDGGRPKRPNDAPYPTAVREFLDGFLQSMLAQDADAAMPRLPAEEIYDARVAEAVKVKTGRPLFKIPSPVAAVSVAIENEHPYLTPEEARGRAEELVDEALAERRAINDRRRAEADSLAATVVDRKRTSTAQEVWA